MRQRATTHPPGSAGRSRWLSAATRSVPVLVLPALLLALVLSSCSDDQPASSSGTAPVESTTTSAERDGSSSSTTELSSPTTTVDVATAGATENDEVIARYIGYWDARRAANDGTPDPLDPGLTEFATGPQLEAVISETRANLERGVAFRPAATPAGIQRVTVIELSGDRAVVQECVVSDGVVVRRDTGEVVDDSVATHNVRGTLVRIDGVWKVSSAEIVQRWEGVAGCALAS